MSKLDLVPAYYDGQDRSSPPLFLKSREDIRLQRKAGTLHGGYQENGSVFVVYRPARAFELPDLERLILAGNMRDAWITKQSGYAGPLVLQMPSLAGRTVSGAEAAHAE